MTEEVIGYAKSSVLVLLKADDQKTINLLQEFLRIIDLGQRVITQTRARLLEGRHLPAKEKVVSIFESHTDVIVKGKRDIQFGHKVFFSVGASSLIFDVLVTDGNPADASLTVELVNRTACITGRLPRQVSMDGCFSSRENLEKLKSAGVSDVCFSKGRGIKLSEMVKSPWVFKQLFRFRAGVEGVISHLKRNFGLRRCTRHGRLGFEQYVLSSVVACNLLTMARHLLK